MDPFELSPETAHPNAKKLLTEDFYWSPIEETAPFGNDDGSDSFYGFIEWRALHKDESPATYFNELIEEWRYPRFNLNVTEAEDVRKLLTRVDSRIVIGQGNAIIAIGFGQFILEGKIDNDIKDLTGKAIQRALLPDLMNQFRSNYQQTRREQLAKMLAVVEKMSGK